MSLARILDGRVPIIQAPMAGGVTTPELVAAVSNAGAIGSFGFAYSDAARIDADLRAARALTKGPVNANFFVFPDAGLPSEAECRAAMRALEELPILAGARCRLPEEPYAPSLDDQLEPIWAHRPELLTFHFGLPPARVIDRAREYGACVGVTATCVEEAEAIRAAGADFVVAQGVEAGGHRGTFAEDGEGDGRLAAADLLRALGDAGGLPTVSAGGIMTGSDIRRFLDGGAAAVQMGTAFLCCDEAGTSPAHRRRVLEAGDRPTVYTRGFSGRWAQAIGNEFTERMRGRSVLPFPLQNAMTGPLRRIAAERSDGDYQSLWAGSGFARARALPAARLVSALASEMGAP